jgi:hypothetical protein
MATGGGSGGGEGQSAGAKGHRGGDGTRSCPSIGRRFFVAVHVGAGFHAPANEKVYRRAMKRACLAAAAVLRVVRSLNPSPLHAPLPSSSHVAVLPFRRATSEFMRSDRAFDYRYHGEFCP